MQSVLKNSIAAEIALSCRRLRVFLRAIYHDEEMSEALCKYMRSVKGVTYAKANPVTGKVLVIYDEADTDEYRIGSLLYAFEKGGNSARESNVIDLEAVRKLRDQSEIGDFEGHSDKGGDGRPPFYRMPKWDIERLFNTSISNGLTEKQAQELQKNCGLNVLSEKKKKSLIAKLFGNLFDFSNKLLIGVGVVSLLAGQLPDAIAIFSIVAIQTVLSTLQSHKAENSLASLKGMMVSKARVIRDGKERAIAAKYLVPGDIIVVESGDKIPADARLVECAELKTTEASLTGESAAVEKNARPCRKNADIGSRHNMLFMGSDVVCGRAKALVTATGMRTEIGKIASMLQNIQENMPPIQKKVNKLTKMITLIASCASLLFIGAGLMTGKPLGEVLVLSICFSIGAIPESLPAVVTASMAMSVQRMAKKNAIVRDLPAVETLGSTDVICCDKTGTLTVNEMSVRRIFVDNAFYTVTGSGYSPSGEICPEDGIVNPKDALELLLRAGVLCNNACVSKTDGKWSVQGDPTEGALLTAAGKYGIDAASLETGCRRIREIPFDSSRQCMITHTASDNGEIAFCKGSHSKVAEKCSSIYKSGLEIPFTDTEKEDIQRVCDALSNEALRVLAFAYKRTGENKRELDSEYVFLGLVGMSDPARPAARESIQRCKNAGVRVLMITGDNKNTAAEIARQVGLLTDGLVVTGADIDAMTDAELAQQVDSIQVFARTCPEQKHRIVKALKKAGHTVAMIGDGVNDAPAMKEADIGIAMGKNGSDVAKDVAAITLVDDDLSTIVDAIQEGRAVTKNIENAVKYLLTGAFGGVAAIALCSFGFGVLPLLSIQILWINVIAETIIGSALVSEPPDLGLMDTQPSAHDEPLLNRAMMKQVFKNGALIGLSTLGIFSGATLFGLGLAKARTLAFSTLIISQLIYAYHCRGAKGRPLGNFMRAAMLSSVALLLGIVYFHPLQSFFGTVPLNPVNAGAVCLASSLGGIRTAL